MVSYRDRMTWVGATANDEMCNFYMMYWVQGQVTHHLSNIIISHLYKAKSFWR